MSGVPHIDLDDTEIQALPTSPLLTTDSDSEFTMQCNVQADDAGSSSVSTDIDSAVSLKFPVSMFVLNYLQILRLSSSQEAVGFENYDI